MTKQAVLRGQPWRCLLPYQALTALLHQRWLSMCSNENNKTNRTFQTFGICFNFGNLTYDNKVSVNWKSNKANVSIYGNTETALEYQHYYKRHSNGPINTRLTPLLIYPCISTHSLKSIQLNRLGFTRIAQVPFRTKNTPLAMWFTSQERSEAIIPLNELIESVYISHQQYRTKCQHSTP